MAQLPRKHIILLPERRYFNGQQFSRAFGFIAKKLSALDSVEPGESWQLQRYFECVPKSWPMAAVFRQHEVNDAYAQHWLRADPLYLQTEMHGARVMAWGNLPLSLQDKQAMLSALKPVFGDFGFELCVSQHDFFYVRALSNSKFPEFIAAPEILGCDLASVLPTDKQWLAIFNECQIILHNHPLNVQRQRNGQLPINALWFWGQGALPHVIYHHFEIIHSMADDIEALKSVARMHTYCQENTLQDLRAVRDWSLVEKAFNAKHETVFDFADGMQWHWQPKLRWYFWRTKAVAFA